MPSSTTYYHCSINYFAIFLIARSIQAENGGFLGGPECKNLLYLLDMSSKVYKVDKIDKKKLIKLNLSKEIDIMKLIK